MIVFGRNKNKATEEPQRKLCHFCGKDITRKKRIKNSRGMYACMRCAEQRRKELERRKNKTYGPDLTDDDLLEILGKVPGAAVAVQVCKKCGAEMGPEDVLCTACGQPVHGELVARVKVPSRRRGLFGRRK